MIETSMPPAGAGPVSRMVCTAASPPVMVDGDTEPGASMTAAAGDRDGVAVGDSEGRGLLGGAAFAGADAAKMRTTVAAAAGPPTHRIMSRISMPPHARQIPRR
ncbi:hypothetical protein GCM10020218_042980 [Dactylosporangium vinaceum]